jgi:hypothetical protein
LASNRSAHAQSAPSAAGSSARVQQANASARSACAAQSAPRSDRRSVAAGSKTRFASSAAAARAAAVVAASVGAERDHAEEALRLQDEHVRLGRYRRAVAQQRRERRHRAARAERARGYELDGAPRSWRHAQHEADRIHRGAAGVEAVFGEGGRLIGQRARPPPRQEGEQEREDGREPPQGAHEALAAQHVRRPPARERVPRPADGAEPAEASHNDDTAKEQVQELAQHAPQRAHIAALLHTLRRVGAD